MKTIKFLSVVAFCAMTLFATAATTAKVKITITSTGGGSDILYLLEGTDYSSAFEDGKDVDKIMNSGQTYNINLYAVCGGHNLSMLYTNDLAETPLTFQSNETETDYTMTFSNVTGTVILYDQADNSYHTLANSGTYNFTCAANSTIANRFIINHAPLAAGICHRYGKLQVSGSNGQSVAVKNMDDSATSIGTVAITADYQEIDLAGLAAGQYKVEWNSQTLIIDVK